MDLVERDRRKRAVDGELNQGPCLSRPVGLGTDPLRANRFQRPDDDDRLGRLEPFLDDLAVRAVGRELVVAPDLVAGRPKHVRNLVCLPLGRSGIRDENV